MCVCYIDSDVFLADSVDFADSLDFLADSWTFFHDSWARLKITSGHTTGPEGRGGGLRSARSAERRPERSPEGPAVHPCVIFKFYHPSWKQSQDTQQKSQRYSVKFTLLSQKQRRYGFDSDVYAKIVSIFTMFALLKPGFIQTTIVQLFHNLIPM